MQYPSTFLHSFPRFLTVISAGFFLAQASLAQPLQPEENPGPFGIGSSSIATRDMAIVNWTPQMAAIGIHYLRDPGATGWVGTTPKSFNHLIKKVDYLAGIGISTGGTFYNYRSGKDKFGFPLDDLPGWSDYVTASTAATKGKIKYWELWNEPPNGTHNSPGSDYAKLLVATYDAAKKGNPDCLVGVAAKSAAINYLDQTIKSGGKGHFDYITLHPYESLDCMREVPGSEPLFMSIVPIVRKMLAARDPEKVNVPIMFTEIGCDAKNGEPVQADLLLKAYTMGIAQGVYRIYWYEGIDGDDGPKGLLRGNKTERPSYHAMAQMIKILGQTPKYLGWVMFNEKSYGFIFQGAQEPVLITWAPLKSTDKVDFKQPVKTTSPLTGETAEASSVELTQSPIFISTLPSTLVDEAKANKDKPLPWGGDYSNAKSVSVTMGETNVEKGLHTRSAKSVAAAVLAYGGSARVGSVPGGNVFLVDPNFLSYTSTPIEITAVVRRNEANDPVNLELEYESTSGYKKAPKFAVPDNKTWHTATWKIDDSQFVSMWAFNFRFNTGKYVIQSVTVTKR